MHQEEYLKVKEELDRLLCLAIISIASEPTDWCESIIVTPKSTGIRLCIDFSKLNDSVLQEQDILPTVDQTLALLADAKVVSKLDCNSAFLQILLPSESQLLTTFITPIGRFCFWRVPFSISSVSENFQKEFQQSFRVRRRYLSNRQYPGFQV